MTANDILGAIALMKWAELQAVIPRRRPQGQRVCHRGSAFLTLAGAANTIDSSCRTPPGDATRSGRFTA
jgi:hypothetical protein